MELGGRWRWLGFCLLCCWLTACDEHAAPDSGTPVDAGVDADARDEAPPQCGVSLRDIEWVYVRTEGFERNDVEVRLIVVVSTESELRAESGGLPVDDGDAFLEVHYPRALGAEYALPNVGDSIIVIGGSSFLPDAGYARVMTDEHEILWEGGSVGWALEDELGRGPYFTQRASAAPVVCREPLPTCCCVNRAERDVFVVADGEQRLEAGETVELTIDGALFEASSQGLYFLDHIPCGCDDSCFEDEPGGVGTAFLVRLAGQ